LTFFPTFGIVRRTKPERSFENFKVRVGNTRAGPVEGIMMEQDFIDRMKNSLTDLKSEIIANLMAGSEDFKQIMEGMDPKDLADTASDDIDRKMIEAIGSQELKRLKLIDSALTRIQQGKYGLCLKCGKRIPQDRLEAIPYALMCVECKTAEERRNR
jgi:RNA polymerase-binding protein DksA